MNRTCMLLDVRTGKSTEKDRSYSTERRALPDIDCRRCEIYGGGIL